VAFNKDWKQDATRVQGRVVYKSGWLYLGDTSSEVIWKIELPSPLKGGKISFEFNTLKNQQSGSLFALSKDMKKWNSLSCRQAEWLERQNTFQLEGSLKPLAGSRDLYIRYRQKGIQRSRLRSFVVEAELIEESFEMPEETKENLKALGYIH